jgi:hypothetical protein
MFYAAPMQVTRIDIDGNVSSSLETDDEEGYTSIQSMPKNVIQSPMDFTKNIPTSGKRAMEFGMFVETKQDFESMTAGLGFGKR